MSNPWTLSPPPDVDTPVVCETVPIRETPTVRSPGHGDDDNNTARPRNNACNDDTTARPRNPVCTGTSETQSQISSTETTTTVATLETDRRPNVVTSVVSALGTTPTRTVSDEGSPLWSSVSQSRPLPRRQPTPSRRASLVGSVPQTSDEVR